MALKLQRLRTRHTIQLTQPRQSSTLHARCLDTNEKRPNHVDLPGATSGCDDRKRHLDMLDKQSTWCTTHTLSQRRVRAVAFAVHAVAQCWVSHALFSPALSMAYVLGTDFL